ncbi:SDR family oxidoreductase [Epidermidibacterium keratini]|uniref:SDR family oxidoreductase n=1 Tax=Epidermidibacterium keratini TaxID=1891644 RepID=A0A7L4YIY4_9ACTN|nr:SDR family NAD(P)-dependent oxidoreductase [Epidermidibacterium keratini]QHB99294.1 SDR family oxidoreductase [Epidermidibacterium keratini]
MSRLSQLSRSIAERVIIVTGAGSGMGRATAHLLADEGAKVGIVDTNPDGLKQVAGELESAGASFHAVLADLGESGEPARAVAEVRQALGPIDGLVNNAGVSMYTPTDDPEFDEKWDRVLAVNLTAQQQLVRAAREDLARNGDGRIVNIASTEGLGATARLAAYTASKHGVIGLTRALAVELGPLGITVNCICPGPINTGMTQKYPDEAKEIYARRRVALRRYGEPEEVAHMTLAFLLPAASFTTGGVLAVDGGVTVRNA